MALGRIFLVGMISFSINPFEFLFFFCLDDWIMETARSRDAYCCIQIQLLNTSRIAFPLKMISLANLPDLQITHCPNSSIRANSLIKRHYRYI